MNRRNNAAGNTRPPFLTRVQVGGVYHPPPVSTHSPSTHPPFSSTHVLPPTSTRPLPPTSTRPHPPTSTHPHPSTSTHPHPPTSTHPHPPMSTRPHPPTSTRPLPPSSARPFSSSTHPPPSMSIRPFIPSSTRPFLPSSTHPPPPSSTQPSLPSSMSPAPPTSTRPPVMPGSKPPWHPHSGTRPRGLHDHTLDPLVSFKAQPSRGGTDHPNQRPPAFLLPSPPVPAGFAQPLPNLYHSGTTSRAPVRPPQSHARASMAGSQSHAGTRVGPHSRAATCMTGLQSHAITSITEPQSRAETSTTGPQSHAGIITTIPQSHAGVSTTRPPVSRLPDSKQRQSTAAGADYRSAALPNTSRYPHVQSPHADSPYDTVDQVKKMKPGRKRKRSGKSVVGSPKGPQHTQPKSLESSHRDTGSSSSRLVSQAANVGAAVGGVKKLPRAKSSKQSHPLRRQGKDQEKIIVDPVMKLAPPPLSSRPRRPVEGQEIVLSPTSLPTSLPEFLPLKTLLEEEYTSGSATDESQPHPRKLISIEKRTTVNESTIDGTKAPQVPSTSRDTPVDRWQQGREAAATLAGNRERKSEEEVLTPLSTGSSSLGRERSALCPVDAREGKAEGASSLKVQSETVKVEEVEVHAEPPHVQADVSVNEHPTSERMDDDSVTNPVQVKPLVPPGEESTADNYTAVARKSLPAATQDSTLPPHEGSASSQTILPQSVLDDLLRVGLKEAFPAGTNPKSLISFVQNQEASKVESLRSSALSSQPPAGTESPASSAASISSVLTSNVSDFLSLAIASTLKKQIAAKTSRAELPGYPSTKSLVKPTPSSPSGSGKRKRRHPRKVEPTSSNKRKKHDNSLQLGQLSERGLPTDLTGLSTRSIGATPLTPLTEGVIQERMKQLLEEAQKLEGLSLPTPLPNAPDLSGQTPSLEQASLFVEEAVKSRPSTCGPASAAAHHTVTARSTGSGSHVSASMSGYPKPTFPHTRPGGESPSSSAQPGSKQTTKRSLLFGDLAGTSFEPGEPVPGSVAVPLDGTASSSGCLVPEAMETSTGSSPRPSSLWKEPSSAGTEPPLATPTHVHSPLSVQEIAVLNSREVQLQKSLVECTLCLSELDASIKQRQRELQKYISEYQQLQQKEDQLSQDYAAVLSEKGNLLNCYVHKKEGRTSNFADDMKKLTQKECDLQHALIESRTRLNELPDLQVAVEREMEAKKIEQQGIEEKKEKVTEEYQVVLVHKLQWTQRSKQGMWSPPSGSPTRPHRTSSDRSHAHTVSVVMKKEPTSSPEGSPLALPLKCAHLESKADDPMDTLSRSVDKKRHALPPTLDLLAAQAPPALEERESRSVPEAPAAKQRPSARDRLSSQPGSVAAVVPEDSAAESMSKHETGSSFQCRNALGDGSEGKQQEASFQGKQRKASKEKQRETSEANGCKDGQTSNGRHSEDSSSACEDRKTGVFLRTAHDESSLHVSDNHRQEERPSKCTAHSPPPSLPFSSTPTDSDTDDNRSSALLKALPLAAQATGNNIEMDSNESVGGVCRPAMLQTVSEAAETMEGGTGGNESDARSPVRIFESHGTCVLAMKSEKEEFANIAEAKGGELYTCSSDKTIRAYNIKTGAVVKRFASHQRSVTSLEFYSSTSHNYLLTGSSDKYVHMYDIKSANLVSKYNFGMRVMAMAVASQLAFVGLSSGTVVALQPEMGHMLGKHSCHGSGNSSISCLCVYDHFLFTAAFDMNVICWDVRNALQGKSDSLFEKVHELSSFQNTVLCMQVCNNLIYCGSADHSLRVFNIETWAVVRTITDHLGAVSALDVVGKVLFTACFDKLVRCFDMESYKLLQVYGGNADMVFTLCADKNVICIGLRDGTVKAIELDFTKYFKCQWEKCGLRFGLKNHLEDHLTEHVTSQAKGSSDGCTCKWTDCLKELDHTSMSIHVKTHVQEAESSVADSITCT